MRNLIKTKSIRDKQVNRDSFLFSETSNFILELKNNSFEISDLAVL